MTHKLPFKLQSSPQTSYLVYGAGKLISIVCPRPDIPLVNHSHLQVTRVSRRHLYNAGLPLSCPSRSPVGACVTHDWSCRGFAERVEKGP